MLSRNTSSSSCRCPAGLDVFDGCIDLTYLRDSLTNIHIFESLSPGRSSTIFLGAEYISPCYAVPTIVCACVW